MDEKSLTSQAIKKYALEKVHVDKIGIANIERFKDAPPDMNPLNIMPRAKSVIVYVKRILRGSYRGIDEGTHYPSYTVFCYSGLNNMLGHAGYKIARFVENFGYEATYVGAMATTREWGPRGPSPRPGMPKREVVMQIRIAAALAGLGEIGWSKVFMTKELGPRLRIGVILTEAELEPDPIRVGELCDSCKLCVKECPGGAIPKDKSVGIEVEGHRIEWADIDIGKCKLTHFGLNRKNSPYLAKRFPGLYIPIAGQNVTWREAWDLGYAIFNSVPTYKALSLDGKGHPIAMCGARGCIIGCMKHMEKRGKVGNVFKTKPVFSEEKPWSIPEEPPKIDHHGFIYDPDADTREDEKTQAASAWY